MKKVCVITGGGSGMGLATAKVMGKDHALILVGRNKTKLEKAIAGLKKDGIEAEAFACDIADRDAVEHLAAFAAARGDIAAVIHSAGMSPHMGDAEAILATNALGTIHINEAFYKVMEARSCLIDVSSMASYMAPKIVLPSWLYKQSRVDHDKFMHNMMRWINLFPKQYRAYLAYVISKHFVIWYAKTDAARFGEKGSRVLSVSPGFFKTPMGDLEKDMSSGYIQFCAIKRLGRVEEIANLLRFCASPQAGYLTGVDILCDGGCIASGVTPKEQMSLSNQQVEGFA